MNLNTAIIEKYRLSNIKSFFAPTSVNMFYSAYSEVFKKPVILKFYKYEEEQVKEFEFLTFYNNPVFVELYDTDYEFHLNVLEKIEPGQTYVLDFLQNEASAIQDVCTIVHLMKNTNKPIPSRFQNIQNYSSSLNKNYTDKYEISIQKCKKIFNELITTAKEENQYLLHGDLHHENILKSQKSDYGFTVIDPKGVIGECEFEIACFILNPVSQLAVHQNAKIVIENRIQEFSKQLNLDEMRLTKYCFIKAILSTCFAIEDNIEKTRMEFGILSKICENLLTECL